MEDERSKRALLEHLAQSNSPERVGQSEAMGRAVLMKFMRLRLGFRYQPLAAMGLN